MRPLNHIGRRRFLRKFFLGFAAVLFTFFKSFFGHWNHAIAGFNFWRSSEYVGKTRGGEYKQFYIQYYKSFRRVDRKKWRLKVSGLCENPQEFTLDALETLPRKTQVSRIKCVECWSAKAEWTGFAISEVEKLVSPLPEAVGIVFRCADTYVEYLSLKEMHHERTLMTHSMNNAALSDEHGFPLRLIIPFKYGYKSPKAILEMIYVDRFNRGTWTQIGPYSADGTILPGYDHPLERGKKRRQIFGGEILD